MSSSTTKTTDTLIPEIEDHPKDTDLLYEKVAAVYTFKNKKSLLQDLLLKKAGHIFTTTTVTFSLYRLLLAFHFIIERFNYFDPSNEVIIWCDNNELLPVFLIKCFHLTELENRLKSHLKMTVACLGNGWIRIHPYSRQMAFKAIIDRLESRAPTWGSKNSYSFTCYSLADKVNTTKRIVKITPELKAFLLLKQYDGKVNCYKCMFTFIDKYCKDNLEQMHYGISNNQTLYIACTEISSLFGNVQAFTRAQLKRMFKYHLTSGYSKAPITCHPSLTENFFNLTSEM